MQPQLPFDLPTNGKAERSCIAAVLVGNQTGLLEELGDEAFFDHRAQCLWRAMQRLVLRNERIDTVTLWEELGVDKPLIGGIETLAEWTDGYELMGGARRHAELLNELAARRRMIHAASQAIQLASDPTVDVSEAVEFGVKGLVDASKGRRDGDLLTGAEVVHRAYRDLEARAKGETGTRVPYYLDELDRVTGGLGVGEQHVFGARPKMGKSAFAFSLATRLGGHGVPVLGFSMEMGAELLGRRAMADVGSINTERMLSPDATTMADCLRAVTEIEKLPLWFHVKRLTLERLESIARRWRATSAKDHPSPVVIVDYLQLADTRSMRGINRAEQVAEISRRLKQLAVEIEVPMLVLAQLNRGVDSREDKRPRPSDFKDSGGIEQDADKILLLWRPHVYDDTKPPTDARIVVIQREGASEDTCHVHYAGAYSRFENKPEQTSLPTP